MDRKKKKTSLSVTCFFYPVELWRLGQVEGCSEWFVNESCFYYEWALDQNSCYCRQVKGPLLMTSFPYTYVEQWWIISWFPVCSNGLLCIYIQGSLPVFSCCISVCNGVVRFEFVYFVTMGRPIFPRLLSLRLRPWFESHLSNKCTKKAKCTKII